MLKQPGLIYSVLHLLVLLLLLYIYIFFFGQLHEDVPTEEHPGNLTLFCHNALTATAYQLINTT